MGMPGTLAISTDIREEIISLLQNRVVFPFQVQDGDHGSPIVPSAVIYHKTTAQNKREDYPDNTEVDTPGLLVSETRSTLMNPPEGDNERDLWHYFILVQLVDTDLWDNADRVRTWDKWIEQIASYFNFWCPTTVAPPHAQGFATASPVSQIDQNRWVRSANFIMGVEIHVRLLQPRGVIL
jgi:hypothetical protein